MTGIGGARPATPRPGGQERALGGPRSFMQRYRGLYAVLSPIDLAVSDSPNPYVDDMPSWPSSRALMRVRVLLRSCSRPIQGCWSALVVPGRHLLTAAPKATPGSSSAGSMRPAKFFHLLLTGVPSQCQFHLTSLVVEGREK
jgi:hypothetical protein